MMLDFIKKIPQDLHPILIHFPIAFLGFSFLLSFLSMRVSRWNEASWLLLWVEGCHVSLLQFQESFPIFPINKPIFMR